MNAYWAIGLVVGLSTLEYTLMGYAGYDPSVESESAMALSLALAVSWWALDDAKKQRYHRPYEFGAFILFAWPIVLPAYLIATRGWNGLLLFTLFVSLFYFPWAAGWAAYYLNSLISP